MKLYFACTGKDEPTYLSQNGFKTILMSYHYYKKDSDYINNLISFGCDIFIDSGAFSAKYAGGEIDIDQYIDFLKQFPQDKIIIAGLDVIGDSVGTIKNQQYMESKGINPIPTFHMGEPIEDLDYLIDNYEYIAIGSPIDGNDAEYWYDNLWNRILKKKKDLKCHGFGMTNAYHMMKYPWYSVDSSSFKSGKRFGRLPLYNSKTNKLFQDNYNNFLIKLYELTKDERLINDNKHKYQLTDLYGANAYQQLVNHVNNRHCSKDFSYLSAQTSLF